ncbi:MAG: hypothetical protein WCI05_06030 [Myxococcales bacterium]
MTSPTLTAQDLWPLARKLDAEERIRLARLLLVTSSRVRSDADAYEATPPGDHEFSSDEEGALAWEGEGWEEFYASR